ncbi:hypothetical protein CSB93_3739 [Pseudomonas paraeruginosa]|uniref:Uncharacterized protein n=1 Tax=Pseudomonas paraeruginosa TaxID=2994495 RepID=A0A2R3IUI9_9PSED|nr:hypothetical protein CSB93_3739 [Pseudomonas paraeruginosa]AWE94877.1 hypothetical protein CSC28_2521 [Pseudomonas paraeruginosa]PTC37285.1 hypothetical protein CLJ1_2273 [Pseudomonas aeruginosa]
MRNGGKRSLFELLGRRAVGLGASRSTKGMPCWPARERPCRGRPRRALHNCNVRRLPSGFPSRGAPMNVHHLELARALLVFSLAVASLVVGLMPMEF